MSVGYISDLVTELEMILMDEWQRIRESYDDYFSPDVTFYFYRKDVISVAEKFSGLDGILQELRNKVGPRKLDIQFVDYKFNRYCFGFNQTQIDKDVESALRNMGVSILLKT